MPLFRRILQIAPFFAGPIFGVVPVNPIQGQIYLYNLIVLAILFASWTAILSILSQYFFRPNAKGELLGSKLKAVAILVLLALLAIFVFTTITLARTSIPQELFYLVLALLAGAALHQRATTTSPGDRELLTGFIYGFGLALLSIWLGILNQGFDWIVIVPAVAIAALCSFHQVALIVESEGAAYFRAEAEVPEYKKGPKKTKQKTLLDSIPHPRRYARLYTAMLLLGPVALALLTSLEILPPPYLLPLIAVPIMTSNFQGIHLAKHSGSFPHELGRKSTNFSILLLILVIVAGLTSIP